MIYHDQLSLFQADFPAKQEPKKRSHTHDANPADLQDDDEHEYPEKTECLRNINNRQPGHAHSADRSKKNVQKRQTDPGLIHRRQAQQKHRDYYRNKIISDNGPPWSQIS